MRLDYELEKVKVTPCCWQPADTVAAFACIPVVSAASAFFYILTVASVFHIVDASGRHINVRFLNKNVKLCED